MTTGEPQKKVRIREPKDAFTSQIDWETVTEKELEDRASVFSFEISTLKRRLGGNSNWSKIIVAHIYVDHILTQTLTENMQNPSAINKNRRKYVLDKLEMCEAMGWIDTADAVIIKKLNTKRIPIGFNRFS